MKKASSIILRVGIALVIIWFGFQQVLHPADWFAYLPTWATTLPISQIAIIYINGWFEIVFGLALFFGFYTRFVAFLLALHLLDITYTVGYGAIGVRDFGLAIATISIFFYGMSPFSADMFFATDDTKIPPAIPQRNIATLNTQPIPPTAPYGGLAKALPIKRTY